MDGTGAIDTKGAEALDGQTEGEGKAAGEQQTQARDFEAEARRHGWTEKEAFKGDPAKWVDAETFVKRADEVMPFLKKQNQAIKREFDEFKREARKALKFMGEAEQRGYERALAELQAKHDEAVESGDVAAARKVVKEMGELTKPETPTVADDRAEDAGDPAAEFAAWVEDNDWYVTDDKKRAYADIQANAMGPAQQYKGGPQAWLDELAKRVSRKFAEKQPSAVNGGGNRSGANGSGGKGYADLPAEAKRACDKWVAEGLIESRDAYIKSYFA